MDGSEKPGWKLSLSLPMEDGKSHERPTSDRHRNVWLPQSTEIGEPRVHINSERVNPSTLKQDPPKEPKQKKIKKPKLAKRNQRRRAENLRCAILFVEYASYTAINRLFFYKGGDINASGLHAAMKKAIQAMPGKYASLEAAGGLLSLDCFQELVCKNRNRFETRDQFEQRHRNKSVRR